MIDISVNSNPFSVKNECGDFYLLTELEDYHLLVVGDIGGHGSNTIYQIANIIKEYIMEYKEENIKDILQKVHEHSSLKNTGMTVFIAQVYKNMPLMNYCAIGNTRSIIFRDNNLLTLNTQDGIVGYDIPSQIMSNMIKLVKNDLVIVATDGVSFHNTQNIVSKLKQTKDIDSITYFFTHDLKNEDDCLCIALKFDQLSSNDFSIQYTKDSAQEEINSDPYTVQNHSKNKSVQKINTTSKNSNKTMKVDSLSDIFSFQKKIKLWKLDIKYLLVANIEKEAINLAIDKIKLYGSLQKIDVVKIKTFLFEVINRSQVDLYIKDNLLQIVVKHIGSYKNSIEFIFEQYSISDDEAIIEIYMDKYIKLSLEEFKDLQNMIKLNLNDKDYALYKEREKFLSDMAYKDNLTNIYNRNRFNEVAQLELQRDNRYRRNFSVGLIDIDHFKSFNDSYGHLIGDEVLVMLAQCLRENVRAADTYARWGGEEFVLLFPETDIDQAFMAAEHLRKSISELSHKTAGSITASFGVTQYQKGDSLQTMFKRCDDALYDAKAGGRNMVCTR